MPARVDAIVVPGGSGDRIGAAVNLAKQGQAHYLIISKGLYVQPGLCGSRVGGGQGGLFQPDPGYDPGRSGGNSSPDQAVRLPVYRGRHDARSDAADRTSLPAVLKRQDLRRHHAAADAFVAIHDCLSRGRICQSGSREPRLLTLENRGCDDLAGGHEVGVPVAPGRAHRRRRGPDVQGPRQVRLQA
jgi:hypothetical protein